MAVLCCKLELDELKLRLEGPFVAARLEINKELLMTTRALLFKSYLLRIFLQDETGHAHFRFPLVTSTYQLPGERENYAR